MNHLLTQPSTSNRVKVKYLVLDSPNSVCLDNHCAFAFQWLPMLTQINQYQLLYVLNGELTHCCPCISDCSTCQLSAKYPLGKWHRITSEKLSNPHEK